MIQAVIFDCFGVLVTEGWLAFKTEHFGHDKNLFEESTDISGRADAGLISHEEAVRLTSDLAGVTPEEFTRAVFKNVPNKPLFNYIIELKDDYKIGMLSNASGNWLEQLFTPDQIALFNAVKLSYELGYVKPDPRAYIAIAEALATDPKECIFVDDIESQLDGARQTGMKTVLYENFEQTRDELENLLADSKS